ncbi:MAG: hypothetical protein Q9175_000509 [Cornicularia normoerica]
MSSTTTKYTTKVLRTLILATGTPFTIYSAELQTPNGQVEAIAQQQRLQPEKMPSAPVHSTAPVYDTFIAFLDFLDASGIPWTILGGFLIVAGILGVQALGSNLERLYVRYVKNEDGAEGIDE